MVELEIKEIDVLDVGIIRSSSNHALKSKLIEVLDILDSISNGEYRTDGLSGWACESMGNWAKLRQYALLLSDEYNYRYGRTGVYEERIIKSKAPTIKAPTIKAPTIKAPTIKAHTIKAHNIKSI